MAGPAAVVLDRAQWEPRARAHETRAARWADPFVARRHRGDEHPVEDFLFTYYTLKPAQLKRWHPGAGTVLLDAAGRAGERFYRPLRPGELDALGLGPGDGAVTVDDDAFRDRRGAAVDFTRAVLGAHERNPGFFGCFGLHEWAMAYRSEENALRHEQLPLRLGAAGTDAVVESARIRCTHFDAFRFFQPQAVPLNEVQPTREAQRRLEQPGCLHATMDLYKWAYKLVPAIPSELVLDCFELARDVRETDMQAAPYDLTGWGYEPVRIETPEGKAEYVRRQRDFARRAAPLRRRLGAALEVLDPHRATAGAAA
ncbi:3-methyladenine DNA glycosylase [Kocuria flava]|uniref:3-methyladenine DNA glycosylase n=1 Tax=Kocuria flava TaxID=446860 RepID=UPI001FF407A8|nr:3-methyladenine DNA glycosylase [Kocuria flava]MCJ8504681.1 3-methyladenine DNA glycosylase [Kocuria flava]